MLRASWKQACEEVEKQEGEKCDGTTQLQNPDVVLPILQQVITNKIEKLSKEEQFRKARLNKERKLRLIMGGAARVS